MPAHKLLLVVIELIIFVIAFPRLVYAEIPIFSDDFSSKNEAKWNYYSNNGSVVFGNNILSLSSSYINTFPYVTLRNISFPNSYSIYFDFNFIGSPNYGSGIVFSDKTLGNGTPADLFPSDFIFAIWPDGNKFINISSSLCDGTQDDCVDGRTLNILHKIKTDDWHKLVISYVSRKYSVYVDGSLIYESPETDKSISDIWLGNPQATGGPKNWSTLLFDKLEIVDEVIAENNPIVIIPGLGASWDLPALLTGTSGNNWAIPNYVTVYDNLINSLVNIGYKKNENIFIFAYDWRKSLDSLADELNTYINDRNLSSGAKIDIVGHSMGGLVARSYIQKYGAEKLNKVVLVGTPNMGAVDAYGVWEGASVWGNVWWEKAILDLSVEVNQRVGEKKVDTVRRLAPSIKDLLPTFSYIKSRNILIPWSQMRQKNEYLNNLNLSSSRSNSVITAIWSNVGNTKSSINVTERSSVDRILNLWEDGKPISGSEFNYSEGDGTVTLASAKGNFTNLLQSSSYHYKMAADTESVKKIFEALGLDQSKVLNMSEDSEGSVFVAALRSPGKLHICYAGTDNCDEEIGIYLPEQKLFFLPGYSQENLSVQIMEDGKGSYTLHMGKIDTKSAWEKVHGTISSTGQIDTYLINGDQFSVLPDEQTSARNIRLLKEKIRQTTPNWDRYGYTENLINNTATVNIRINSEKILRLLLRNEFTIAKRTNKMEYFETLIEMWKAVDREMEYFLTGNIYFSNFNRNQKLNSVNKLNASVLLKLKTSNSIFAARLEQEAENILLRSKLTEVNLADLGINRINSGEALFLSTLDNR